MAFERLTEEVRNVSALPNVIVGQASTLKATFDEGGSDIKNFINNFLTALETFSAASNIGAMNGELESNLQAIIDEFATSIANRYTKAEIDSKVSTETGDLVKTLDIDLNTGVFTITKKDGTVETIDTTLEKVPTNFAFVEENGMYYLKVTNTDGTSTQVDVTTLFNDYTFNNTDSIAFSTVKDGNEATITAEIRDASIGIEKLSLTAVSQLEGYVSSASQSAQTATTKANEASESATSALNSANIAVNSANSVVDSATSAQTSANNAATSASSASSSAANATSQATLSQSWAVGNTGARDGENTNNAKYWAEQAMNSSQGGDMTKAIYDTNADGVVDNAEKLGGQLPEYYAKSSDLASKQDVLTFDTTPTSGSTKPVQSGGVYTALSGKANSSHTHAISDITNLQSTLDGKASTSHNQSASTITAGTLAGQVVANATAAATLGNAQVRNISAGTTDLTAGTSSLTTGDIYFVFE